jgi:cyclopropane-fatty-acyl-phospholipid synthase
VTRTSVHHVDPVGPVGPVDPAGSVAPGPADAARWPDVAVAGGSWPRAAVARALFTAAVARLPLQVQLQEGPGGPARLIGAGAPGTPVMIVHRPGEFFRRLGGGGLVGLGESYMAGDWDCADLTGLLTVFATRVSALVPAPLQRLRRLAVRRHPAGDDPTPEGARRNVHRHYDLSNDLFALFLDETMTYSAALFGTGPDGAPLVPSGAPADLAGPAVLAEAQRRKIDRLLDRACVRAGTRLLEIGTGWGELALRAAARGARIVTVTISPEQQALAARRVAEAGLSGRVSVELRDYRDIHGQFDAVCSAEMIEAVGMRYWPVYFSVLARVLAPGGRAGLQAITMPHDRMLATRDTYTWIQKYIFPGGLIPSVTAMTEHARSAGLRVADRADFGTHYAETLRIWRDRFTAHAGEVRLLGFDEVFIRMWKFYLSYSEAGFRSGYLDVCQLTLEKEAT